MNGMPSGERISHFAFPSFEQEAGEIARIQQHFNKKTSNFAARFLESARKASLVPLSAEIWNTVENTDSDRVLRGDWDAVAEHASAAESKRNWQDLKTKMQAGTPVDAPVIARNGEILHLVSGNTRLMVARALGITPNVLIVDITDIE